MIYVLAIALAAALGYAVYKHVTVAQIEAELKTIEATAVTDVKAVIARLKAIL